MGPSAGQKKQDSLVYVGEDLSGTVVKLIEVMATVIFDTNPGSLIYIKKTSRCSRERSTFTESAIRKEMSEQLQERRKRERGSYVPYSCRREYYR